MFELEVPARDMFGERRSLYDVKLQETRRTVSSIPLKARAYIPHDIKQRYENGAHRASALSGRSNRGGAVQSD